MATMYLVASDIAALANEGRDAASIAQALGIGSPTSVRIAAQVLEIPLPGEGSPPPLPEQVRDDVLDAGVSPEHAAAVLDPRHHGLGTGKGLTPWPWPPGPPLLAYVYHSLGIGLVELADRLRCDVDQLKQWMADAGIPLRGQDDPLRSRRWQFDQQELRELYVEREWRVADIAEHFGVSTSLVYRAMHRHHLPIEAPTGGEPRVRYDELVADRRVTRALAECGVEPAGINPPLRRKPLPADLLHAHGRPGAVKLRRRAAHRRDAQAVRKDCRHGGVKRPQ